MHYTSLFAMAAVVSATVSECGPTDVPPTGNPPPTIPPPVPTAGTLDPAFGKSGKVTTPVHPNSVANAVVQSDGKILVLATLSDFNIASLVFGLVRYLPDGSLDAGFGNQGVVRTAVTIGFNTANALALADNGDIVVGGSASDSTNATAAVALARYKSDGRLDATFGNAGVVTTPLLGKRDFANVVLLEPGGQILIGGGAVSCAYQRCPENTALVRYNHDGSLDRSFAQTGTIVKSGTDQGAISAVHALALESDGSVLTLGWGPTAVARFAADGTVQPVALTGSIVAIASTGNATFQGDGKILVAGSVRATPGSYSDDIDVKLSRSLLGGAVDPSFDSPQFDFAGDGLNVSNAAQTLLIEPDGKIVVGGYGSPDTFTRSFGLARVNADGSLDGSFGSGGIVSTEFDGTADQVTGLARQADGKIVAVGITAEPGSTDALLALARYLGP